MEKALRADNIADLVKNYIAQDKVPQEEFSSTIEEIRRALRTGKGKFSKIYQLIAADTDYEDIDECTVQYYHNGTDPVPVALYNGAVNTLRWAYKTMNRGALPLRVRNMLDILARAQKGEEPSAITRAVEKKPAQKEIIGRQREAHATEAKPISDPLQETQIPPGTNRISELVDVLVSEGPYSSLHEIEQDLCGRGICKAGQLERAYHRDGTEQLYTNLQGLAMLHNCLKKKHNTHFTNGEVPKYAFDGLLLQAVHLYAGKGLEQYQEKDYHTGELIPLTYDDIQELMSTRRKKKPLVTLVEQELQRRGLCEEGQLISADKTRQGVRPSSMFDSLLLRITNDSLSRRELTSLRTAQDYDASQDYDIGQIVRFPKWSGVVIDKDEESILVYLDVQRKRQPKDKKTNAEASDKEPEQEQKKKAGKDKPKPSTYLPANPIRCRINVEFDGLHKRDFDIYERM